MLQTELEKVFKLNSNLASEFSALSKFGDSWQHMNTVTHASCTQDVGG